MATGTARIVGTRREAIVEGIGKLLKNRGEHQQMPRIVNPYGDGKASKRIVSAIISKISETNNVDDSLDA